MEKGQLTETYRILKNSKWNGLKQETKTALVDDMAMIRPIAAASPGYIYRIKILNLYANTSSSFNVVTL